jgi:hypothetical protein
VVVILVEYGLVVGDEDKSEWPTIGQWESIRAWEFAPIVVPLVEALVINLPALEELTSISHNILPLVAINILPILRTSVLPV